MSEGLKRPEALWSPLERMSPAGQNSNSRVTVEPDSERESVSKNIKNMTMCKVKTGIKKQITALL